MANFSEIAWKSTQLICLYLKNISLNLYRRLLILRQRGGIFWHNRRLAKQFRRLGASVYTKLAAGDVNPLLQDEVKDQLLSLQSLQEIISQRRDAIAQIRQAIQATSYSLAEQSAPPAPAGNADQPENH
jgi:hypothetical protein